MRFRLCILFLFLFLNQTFIYGQDLIVLLAGDTITAKISSTTDTNIVFACNHEPDSLCIISTNLVRKIVYANGKEIKISHVRINQNIELTAFDTSLIIIRGNTYYYKGNLIKHAKLEQIYRPMHDSVLLDTYIKGINMKQGSIILKYLPIPLGVIGYVLILSAAVPTNYFFSNEPEYGNERFVVPGVALMGSALVSGIGGVITHKAYKKLLKNAAIRYNNNVIFKHGL